jgi:putative DNA primase/helicase
MASTPRQPGSRTSAEEQPSTGAQDSFLADPQRSGVTGQSETARARLRNSIRAADTPKKVGEPSSNGETAPVDARAEARKDRRAVPAYFAERYTQVGSKFYLPNEELAFIDRGRVLTTQLENAEIIRDMLAVQRERGETAVTLTGSESFKRKVWQLAESMGMEVRGYRAPATERKDEVPRTAARSDREFGTEESARLDGLYVDRVERVMRDARSSSLAEEPQSNPFNPRVDTGHLVEHGEANYRFDPRKPRSYYVKIDTPQGEVTRWGADLGRALKQSLSGAQVGDEVVVRQLGERPLTVTRPIRNGQGDIVRKEEVKARMNRWSLERKDFLDDRALAAAVVRDPGIDAVEAVNQRPELAGTYAELQVARVMAPQLYAHRSDQERFVTRLREALADEIQRGEALSAPRVKDRSREPVSNGSRPRDRAQERTLS